MIQRKRLVFLDAVRLLAVLQMVNGHTLDAVLAPAWRGGPGFARYDFLRGLVSVSFLVVAGMAFHVTRLSRPHAQGVVMPGPLAPRVRRALHLLAVGYVLRLPFYAVLGGEHARIACDLFFAVDVLGAVAVALLVLELLVRLCPRPPRVALWAALLSIAVFALAPLMDRIAPTGPARPLLAFLTHRGGSSFPVFPWSGYVFAGVAVAHVTCPRGADGSSRRLVGGLLALSLATFALAWALGHSPWSLWLPSSSYAVMPSFAILKLAAVLALLGGSALLLARASRLPAPLAALAEETLFIYGLQYVVLFWPPWSIAGHLGRTLPLPSALATSAAMMVLCATATFAWRARRRLRYGLASSAATAGP